MVPCDISVKLLEEAVEQSFPDTNVGAAGIIFSSELS
jgi:hypothetical protein